MRQVVASAGPFLGPTLLLTAADVRPDLSSDADAALKAALTEAGWKQGARVAYLSVYDKEYPRTRTLLLQLGRLGVRPELFFRRGEPLRLVRDLLRLRRGADIVIVGFRGHELLPWARLLLGRRKGIVFDAFVSICDTLADRVSVSSGSPAYRLAAALDRWLCRRADAVLVDTRAHAAFFEEALGCAAHAVYVEADERFTPGVQAPEHRILWYGTCLPLHGVEKILRWAATCPQRFLLIGPLTRTQRAMADALPNVEVRGRVSPDELPVLIRASALCLGGPFGGSAKAGRVIAGKTYQMLACGRPVLVSDTPANRELLAA